MLWSSHLGRTLKLRRALLRATEAVQRRRGAHPSTMSVQAEGQEANGVPYDRQIARHNLIMVRGKSLMEVPGPNAQSCTARSPNTDIVKCSQHTSLHGPAPRLMPTHQNRSAMYLKPLTSLKAPKQLKLLALLRSFGVSWDSYNSRISRPSEYSTKRWISVQQRTSRSSNLPNRTGSMCQSIL